MRQKTLLGCVGAFILLPPILVSILIVAAAGGAAALVPHTTGDTQTVGCRFTWCNDDARGRSDIRVVVASAPEAPPEAPYIEGAFNQGVSRYNVEQVFMVLGVAPHEGVASVALNGDTLALDDMGVLDRLRLRDKNPVRDAVSECVDRMKEVGVSRGIVTIEVPTPDIQYGLDGGYTVSETNVPWSCGWDYATQLALPHGEYVELPEDVVESAIAQCSAQIVEAVPSTSVWEALFGKPRSAYTLQNTFVCVSNISLALAQASAVPPEWRQPDGTTVEDEAGGKLIANSNSIWAIQFVLHEVYEEGQTAIVTNSGEETVWVNGNALESGQTVTVNVGAAITCGKQSDVLVVGAGRYDVSCYYFGLEPRP